MTNNSNKLHANLTRSVTLYLAYCGLVRACRDQYGFLRGRPAVLGIVIPEGSDLGIYEDAVAFVALGESVRQRKWTRSDDTIILTRSAGHRNTASKQDDIAIALSEKSRVVVVAETAEALPDDFRITADALVRVDPPSARHVTAACRVCLGVYISESDAAFVSTVPLGIIAATLRKGRPAAASIERMRLVTASKRKKDVAGPRLEDLHGLGEAGEWGRELATDLADWQAGKIGWHDVDRGILLSGPPGTGKTTFAGALARTCGAYLLLGSIGRWQAKGHLGDMLKAMRKAFDEAKSNAPSILFLDEIDAVGDREQFNDHNLHYNTEVIAALLECIDGAEGREGVVVVGACNYPERIDAALVRAGRLDRHVRIPLPDPKGREGILRWHLQGALAEEDFAGIVNRTEGWSGASLEKLVRDARRRARRSHRPIMLEDLNSEFPPLVPLPTGLRRRTAVHEAGHAIIGIAIGSGDLQRVTIADAFDPSGNQTQDGGGTTFRHDNLRERVPSEYLDLIAVGLAGLAAEEVVLGSRSAGGGGSIGSDLHTATLNALMMEATYGLGESLVYLSDDRESELFAALSLNRDLRARVDQILSEQYRRSKRIVEERRRDVERLADALVVRGCLSKHEVDDLLIANPGAGPGTSDR
jgi:ATP-dependent Zn protease